MTEKKADVAPYFDTQSNYSSYVMEYMKLIVKQETQTLTEKELDVLAMYEDVIEDLKPENSWL